MIVGPQNRIVALETFQDGLQKAANGVLLFFAKDGVAETRSLVSSAWLITDSLVVVPRYHLSANEKSKYFVCRSGEIDNEIRVKMVDPMRSGKTMGNSILLRLQKSMKGNSLKLSSASASADEKMFLLHFPEGRPEIQISVGRFLSASPSSLSYDADTLPGSSGGAIFSQRGWEVIGMHTGSSESGDSNIGTPLTQILEDLQRSSAWPEIAKFHRIANISSSNQDPTSSVRAPLGAGSDEISYGGRSLVLSESSNANLLAAAVRWSFDPDALGLRKNFAPYVIDPDEASKQWVIDDDERRLILKGHNLRELREARGETTMTDPGQAVIDRILRGPPYSLAKMKDEELPFWLQAVRWFEGVIAKLPLVADINRELGRRRVRGNLRVLTRDKVRGRQQELETLETWFYDQRQGPMIISGLGGIGKSTLISQFVLNQPEEMLILWLDFDRADLAPDDAVSILKVIADQMAIQLSDFNMALRSGDNWREAAATISERLKAETKSDFALLVLDGFEIAQHVEKYGEIWSVLEALLESVPRVRVIVSGRASVRDLELAGKQASELPLKGMAERDAKAWLKQRGLSDPELREQVWKGSSSGVPLILKLAVHLVEMGGAAEMERNFPQRLVEGFLYQRILNRVVNVTLKPLAKDCLVLRNVTVDMVAEILSDSLPEGLDAGLAFEELAREMALINVVTGGGANSEGSRSGLLQIRPEVRAASLRLLEFDSPKRVRVIDERAVKWYERQDLTMASQSADLIYHLLRLGRIEAAGKLWRSECAGHLKYAVDDLQEEAEAERKWLIQKISESERSIESWEQEAVDRIHGQQRRGLVRSMSEIISERSERSSQSPLIFFDAWSALQNGRLLEARQILDAAGPGIGLIGRDRTLLAALIAYREGKRSEADELLMAIDGSTWKDRIERQAVMAARIRLTVDLDKEMQVAEHLRQSPADPEVLQILPPCDAIFSGLADALGRRIRNDSANSLQIPKGVESSDTFAKRLQSLRVESSYDAAPTVRHNPIRARSRPNYREDTAFPEVPGISPSMELFNMSLHRWTLAASSTFLQEAVQLVKSKRFGKLEKSIVASVISFRGMDINLEDYQTVDEFAARSAYLLLDFDSDLFGEKIDLIRRASNFLGAGDNWLVQRLERIENKRNLASSSLQNLVLGSRFGSSPFLSWVILLLSPDPLQALCERVSGLGSEH